jgi:hypothetical protein
MTYTLRQRDGKDSYDIYVEENRGEAGRCPGSGAELYHGASTDSEGLRREPPVLCGTRQTQQW